MVISEFGNWGLPNPLGLLDDDGAEPWWFDTGRDWADGVVYPHDIERRAREWRLDEVFEALPALFKASQDHQFESLQYEVERMRLHPEIAGFVVTEFTDLYWECNGLVDLHRQPKAGHDDFRWVFGADLPIAIPEHRRCSVGDTIQIALHVAHASEIDLTRATVRWRSSDGGLNGESAISVSPWTAPRVAEFTFRPQAAGRIRLEFELVDGQGKTAGRNWTEVAVYERRMDVIPAWSQDSRVLRFLEEAGFAIDRDGVLVTTGLEAPGRPSVLLASAGDAGGGLCAVERVGSAWEGDWAQGMHWFGPDLRRGTPLLARLDITCSGLVPPAVLTGLGAEQTLSGMYVGWIHNAVATAGLVRPDVAATTFPLLESAPDDPLAISLLSNLMYAAHAGPPS
jgi:hypothetical protein